MAITEDASTPLIVTHAGTGTITTASFSPPANSLLVALVSGGWSQNTTLGATVTDSGGHTWTVAATATGTTSNGGVAKIAYTYLSTAPGSITVSAAFTNLTGGSMLAVRVLTGAASSQTGAGTASSARAASTVGTVSVTTTVAGSRVYGISNNATAAAGSLGSLVATTILTGTPSGDYNDTTDNIRIVAWKATSATGTPGATTLGGTWSASADSNTVAFEVLPGGVTQAGAATLSGAASLTAGLTLVQVGASTLAGVSALSSAAFRTQATASTVAAVSVLTGDATSVKVAAATLASTSGFTSAGVRVTTTGATLSASANLTAPAFFTSAGSSTLVGAAALTTDGTRSVPIAATLAAVSALTAAGVTGSSVRFVAGAVLTSAVGVQGMAAVVALPGEATFGGPAFLLEPVAVTLDGAAALTATTLVSSSLTMPAGSALVAGVFLIQSAVATFPAVSALVDTAWQTVQARASLTAVSALGIIGPFQAVGGTGATLLAGSGLVASATASQPGLAPFPPQLVVTTLTPTAAEPRKPTYRLYAANTRTGRIGWELPVEGASWNTPINAAGTLRATLAIEATLDHLYTQGANDPRTALREVLTGPYLNSLVLTYGDAAVFAGPYLPSSIPADKPTIDVGAAELVAIFDKRILYTPGGTALADPSSDLSLGPASQGELVRSIVVTATTGAGRELPITCSNPPNPVGNAQVTYFGFNLTTAGSALGQITSQGIGAPGQLTITPGPDYRLDPYLTAGSDGLYVAWELRIGNPYLNAGIQPWSFDDATSLVSQEIDASKMASTYYVPGSGQDRLKLISTATDSSLVDAGFPMLEEVDSSYTSEINSVLLDSYAAADVARYVSPVDKWIIQTRVEQAPRLGSYRVGDPMVIDVQRHPVIRPGIYPRRITEISGDVSALVSISSAEMLAK